MLINPHKRMETLRHGAIHEVFHALQPEAHGLRAHMAEELKVIDLTREFMNKHEAKVIEAVHDAGVAVRQKLGRPEPAQLKGGALDRLIALLTLPKTKHEETETALEAERRSFLASA